MFRKALLLTSFKLFFCGAAIAQTTDTTIPSTSPEKPSLSSVTIKNMFGSPPSLTASETNKVGVIEPKAGQMLVSSFLGQPIYESDAKDAATVGKLNDLITTSEGQIIAAIIGVGGFLGIGEKDVAISPDQLQLAYLGHGNRWLIIKATKDELNAAPAFDRSLYFPDGVADLEATTRQKRAKEVDVPVTPALPDNTTSDTNNIQPTPNATP